MNSNNKQKRFIKTIFVSIFCLVTTIKAEEKQEPTTTTSSTIETTTSSSTSTTVEEIEALEPWGSKITTTITNTTIKNIINQEHSKPIKVDSVVIEEEGPTEEEIRQHLEKLQIPKEIKLNKTQKDRLKKVKKIQKYYSQEQYQEILSYDPRGDAEINICQANLNGYGTKKDFSKEFKKQPLSIISGINKTLVPAIIKANCNIVALQNVLTPEYFSAKEALQKIIKQLVKATQNNWDIHLGEFYKEAKYTNLFLIKEDVKLVIKKTDNLINLRLPRFEKFQQKKFSTPPSRLILFYNDKLAHKSKEITLINAFLGGKINSEEPESLGEQMQLAEVSKALMNTIRENQEAEENKNPLAILLSDRSSKRYALPTQILEGRFNLKDFKSDGPCKLTEDNNYTCKSHSSSYKQLFGVIADGINDPKTIKIVNEINTEIYLFDKDLKLATKHYYFSVAKYKSGFIEVKNGLKNSPLTWVELNW